MIGETVSHYRIIKKLGEGGMGVVYLAEDVWLQRRVAIKTLNSKRGSGDPHFRARFLREARAISALSHQHIANIYEYGKTDDGQPYIVMELVEGQTLADLMREGKLTIPRTIEIVKQVAEALSEAHLHGIVHRDIKPSNIAINERGIVKVLDFGLAKQVRLPSAVRGKTAASEAEHTQTREGIIIGTPMYLSPEQALGVEVDARSDLFSLGSVLYECIAGRPAFAGKSDIDICAKVIRDDPPAPSTFNGNVSAELDQATLKALAKKLEDRYQSANDLVTHLRAVAESTRNPIHATASPRPPPLTEPLLHAPQTRSGSSISTTLTGPRVPIGYVALALLLIALTAFVAWRVTRAKPYQPSTEAKRWYDEGTRALQDGTYYKASMLLEEAKKNDPKFALAHARLAESWAELGYIDKATSEISEANLLVSNASLSKVDNLYLQAINATLSHDFQRAVDSYRAMIPQVSAGDMPYVYVDLGRAYEKNEDQPSAITNYNQAIAKDPQYASAYLRSGILEARMENFTAADEAFDKAFNLFRIQSNPEGMAEVRIQQGILFMTRGDMPKAREPLQQALQIVQTFTNPSQEIKTLLQLSAVSRTTGDTETAKQYASQALDCATTNGLTDLKTQSLLEIGYVFFFRSEVSEAEKYFESALTSAQADKIRVSEARAQFALGSLRIQQDEADEGIPYIKQALPFFEQNIYRKEIMQAQTVLGQAYALKGQLTEARTAFESALSQAQVLNNQLQNGLAHKNIATVLNNQEKYTEALDHVNQAYSLFNSLGNKLYIGYTLISRADIEWRLGDYDAATSDLNLASSFAEQADTKFQQLWGRFYSTSGPMKLSRQDFRGAIIDTERAIKADPSRTRHPAIEAQYTLGLAQFLSGNKKGGRQTCEQTVTMARNAGDPRLLGAALLASAEVLVESDEAHAALTMASEAETLFEISDQAESQWRALVVTGRARQMLGDNQTARADFLKADSLFTGLEQRFGSENFRRYEARPDVQVYRKQLTVASSASKQ
jgi:serine/threonine protein kinase